MLLTRVKSSGFNGNLHVGQNDLVRSQCSMQLSQNKCPSLQLTGTTTTSEQMLHWKASVGSLTNIRDRNNVASMT
jgi:hypothetical protein